MKLQVLLSTLVLVLPIAACVDTPTGPAPHTGGNGIDLHEEDRFQTLRPGAASPARNAMSNAPVQSFVNPAAVTGTSRLLRKPGGVRLDLNASDLPARTGTTLWVVVFNEPGACVGECDDPDLFENPATKADLLFATGGATNVMGKVNYRAHVAAGDASASIMPLFGLPAWGILDTDRAEIHLIVRDHGPLLPGLENAQITTFNGGCTDYGAEFGTPGPNTCVDAYFASHFAPVN